MDDYLDSFDIPSDAIDTIKNVTAVLKLGGFHLTKFISNNRNILKEVSPENLSPKIVDLDLEELPMERALGVFWDPNSDMLVFKVVNKNVPETKRGILSMVSSIFDPMGLFAPEIVNAKLLIQELWRRGLDWDEQIPDDLKNQWNLWKHSVLKLSSISVPRWIKFKTSDTQTVELHIFADASSKAYGAAAYIKITNLSSSHCNLILGKSKIAPMKNKLSTIPRLELQAALIASRIKVTVLEEMNINIDSTFMWSDSTTVLNYIRNTTTNFGPYIMRRCNEIRENTEINEWRYIPTDLNIADILSRGITTENPNLLDSWFIGPTFITEPNKNYNFEPNYDNVNSTKSDNVIIENDHDEHYVNKIEKQTVTLSQSDQLYFGIITRHGQKLKDT